jgi:hypothetical protein
MTPTDPKLMQTLESMSSSGKMETTTMMAIAHITSSIAVTKNRYLIIGLYALYSVMCDVVDSSIFLCEKKNKVKR